jgi:hypothetical protein
VAKRLLLASTARSARQTGKLLPAIASKSPRSLSHNVAFIWKVRWVSTDAASSFVSQISSFYRTTTASPSASLQAFASNSDALVVGVSGTPNPDLWLNIAKTMNNQNGAASAGNTSGSTGTPDMRVSMRRGLISPIVPIH